MTNDTKGLRTCANCIYLGDQSFGGYQCRRYPPKDTWFQYNQYPTTRLDQSCGEFKEKEIRERSKGE